MPTVFKVQSLSSKQFKVFRFLLFPGIRGHDRRGGEQDEGPEQGESSPEGSRGDRDQGGRALLLRERPGIEQLGILRAASHSHPQGSTFKLLSINF